MNRTTRVITALLLGALAGAAGAAAPAPADRLPLAPGKERPLAASGHLVRDGVAIDFAAWPAEGSELMEDGLADLRFRISDAASGQPVAGLAPGVWLDLAQVVGGRDGQKECKDKIALYLKGMVGIRPLLDLNGYHLLLLNQDPSITVIDPVVSMAGKTSTYGVVMLKRPPMDWAKSPDSKRIYVSMPLAGQVAVVDTGNFKVQQDIDVGPEPVRLALQPDGRYLWVGNNGAQGGVTVIDTQSLKPVLSAATGAGHHEIAFSDDSRLAFVSNRDAGTVSVFDIATLKKLKDLTPGPRPITLAYSALAGALYVADGRAGTITAIDGKQLSTRKVLRAAPGLGPLRLTPDERYAFALNTTDNTATVVDVASNDIIHTLAVSPEPYQIAFTRGYAYVRGLASERVTQINLGSLGKGRQPVIHGFAAGTSAPKLAGNLPIADSMSAAKADAAMYVVNPVDNTTYFYMEGMNAPMAGYPNRGHAARAATVIDRSLKEVEPGVFATRVRLPASGKFDVAFILDQPRVLHCFAAEVKANPGLERKYAAVQAAFQLKGGPVAAKSTVPVRVRLTRGREGKPQTGLTDVALSYFLAPSSPARQVAAREVGDGVYEALIELPQAGAYYLHVGVPSLKLRFGDLPYATLRALAK
ncbi:MAG: cytochrome D1 [Dechloromonas sp.]|nr:cytochrome D1 [Dechloromonas sp.]